MGEMIELTMKEIKKYAIHILAIYAIDEQTFDLPKEQNAIILCTNSDNPYLQQCKQENVLIAEFMDVIEPGLYGAFDSECAKAIIRFIERLSDEVTDLYVCCSKGQSRSPAVAAALLRMSGRDDADVWNNPFYTPNRLVYYLLCKEYGLNITEEEVDCLVEANNMAFRNAQNSGNIGEYERWQILF